MSEIREMEHFVTLFDSNFLPMGMAMHASMMTHAQPFHLWILCMDELVEKQLQTLALPHVSLIPLRVAETEALIAIKDGRTRGEYCWTLTAFTPQFVFERDPTVERVTYLDADLYFFDEPKILLDEFSRSGKHVLITEHAFAPEYEKMRNRGRFCVQFMTFRNTPEGRKVMKWWQERCLEWCFARLEDGKFGDQMYLDSWPIQFGSEVHVLAQTERTLAPWNVAHVLDVKHSSVEPVFFHFHGFRIVSNTRLLLCRRYPVGYGGRRLYLAYSDAVISAVKEIHALWGSVPVLPEKRSYLDRAVRFVFGCFGRIQYREFELDARS